ncbi:helix-turn-helix domain-containing protein [Enterobacteriaceae bacterium C34A]
MNKTMNIDARDSTLCADNAKPVDAFKQLMALLAVDTMRVNMPKSKVLSYSQEGGKVCYILHKGSVAIQRRGDGIVMISESAPFIFGLSNQDNITDTSYLRTLEECEISTITLREANQIILQQNQWKSLTLILLYTMSRIYEHCTQLHQMSSYDIIRFQLSELAKESDEFRMKTTVANYIKSRTYLSRSGIMKILQELRTGGYITVEKGVLKGISYLPKKY